MKTAIFRRIGRAFVHGDRAAMVEALDKVVEPKNVILERISDIAIGFVVDAMLEGRVEMLAGMREALDQVDG
jgi:hypothetical protein